jgi:hypothetical protein
VRDPELAEEIISHLVADSQADVKMIWSDAPFGNPALISTVIKRTVSENAKTLAFKTWTWE